MKSGLPQRLLFSQDGQWVDFSQEVVNLVKEGFRSNRAAIEVKCNGCHFMLDILYMVQVDLKTGAQKPIAWIDEVGNCISPELYSSCHESNVKRIKVDKELLKNIHARSVEEKQKSDEHASPSFESTCGTVDVETARNMFIACLASNLNVEIYEVKKCSSSFMEGQLELFQKQVEITQKLRGKANIRYGWFAASDDASSGVMFYGHNGPKLGMYGYGVHLAAVQSANPSTMVCDDDEKGTRHMVLCRVILGNVEVVHPGSKQFHPSDQCFDSGVDDLQNPNTYVIWNINMNTHIFPECVVSFKLSSNIKGCNLYSSTLYQKYSSLNILFINLPSHEKVPSVGSSTPKEPKSPWMPFSMLFEAISTKVAPTDLKLLHAFYEFFRAKKINREEFIRKMRSVVGDEILRSTITVLRTKSGRMSKAKEVQQG
ncbi:hypothetical protein R6Q59_020270 [Mikania micrantha]